MLVDGLTNKRLHQVVDDLNSDVAARRYFERTRWMALADVTTGRVNVMAEYDDDFLQQAMDERFGPDVVRVISAIQPLKAR